MHFVKNRPVRELGSVVMPLLRFAIEAGWILACAAYLWGQTPSAPAQWDHTQVCSTVVPANPNDGGSSSTDSQQAGQGSSDPTTNSKKYNEWYRESEANPESNDIFFPSPLGLDSPAPGQTGVFLQGHVVTVHGEAPPERVRIMLECEGVSIPQAYTYKRGYFRFSPRAESLGTFTDLSICVLYGEAPGYRSDRLRLVAPRTSGQAGNYVGQIVLESIDGALGHTVSSTTASAPKASRQAYDKGMRILQAKNPNYRKAVGHFDRAVEIYPEFAAAWLALGEARLGLADEAGAGQAFARSSQVDPDFLPPYEYTMKIALDRREWTKLESLTDHYLALSPKSAKVLLMGAMAAVNLDNLSKANSLAGSILAMGEANDWPLTYFLMAKVHERRLEFKMAAEYYRAFLCLSPKSETTRQIETRLTEWEALQVI